VAEFRVVDQLADDAAPRVKRIHKNLRLARQRGDVLDGVLAGADHILNARRAGGLQFAVLAGRRPVACSELMST